MENSFYRGWKIVYKNGQWVYFDNNESTINNERPCRYCMKGNVEEGADGCFGMLPNVMNACCGHGINDGAYIQFWNGNIIRGIKAIEWVKMKGEVL